MQDASAMVNHIHLVHFYIQQWKISAMECKKKKRVLFDLSLTMPKNTVYEHSTYIFCPKNAEC